MEPALQKKIFMMEDHDKALSVWRELGVRARTLVHIDAHIDFARLPEMDLNEMAPQTSSELEALLKEQPLWNPWKKPRQSMVHIGNYIAPALAEGIVDQVYWVVPDPTWDGLAGRKRLLNSIRQLLRAEKSRFQPLLRRDHIYFRVGIKREIEIKGSHLFIPIVDGEINRCDPFIVDFFVCCLRDLPHLEETVLLDIDVDFLMTPYVWRDLEPGRKPWILPQELHGRLMKKNVSFDTLTISYSVEGGFTPIAYKYFGDELRQSFDVPQDEESRRLAVIKKEASACFSAAMRYASDPSADLGKAKESYAKAIALDPSYGSAFNNYGIIYWEKGKLRLAQKEFEKLLKLDENNINSLNGLGFIALYQKRFQEARDYFGKALGIDPVNAPASLGLSVVCFKTKDFPRAQALLRTLEDKASQYPEVFWWQGKLAQQRGDINAAIQFYKEAVLWGQEGPGVHIMLSGLYLKKRMFHRMFEELGRFLRLWITSTVFFG